MIPRDALSNAVRLVTERTPPACRAGPTPTQCRPMKPAAALEQRYRSAWARDMRGLIVVDVDHDDPYGPVLEGRAPPPLLWVHNLDSGHSQPRYAIRAPLDGRDGPALDFLRDLTRDLAAVWGADIRFTGPLVRGEFGPGHLAESGRVQAHSLAELRAMLPATPRADQARADFDAAAGRNCAAFDTLRLDAYDELRRQPSGDTLQAFLTIRAEQVNAQFLHPMRAAEVAGIVRSIYRWCMAHREELTRRASRKAAKLPGANRLRDRPAQERESLPAAQQRANMQAGQRIAADSRREATRARLRVAVAALERQGQPITAAVLVKLTGLSRRTLYDHADLWRVADVPAALQQPLNT